MTRYEADDIRDYLNDLVEARDSIESALDCIRAYKTDIARDLEELMDDMDDEIREMEICVRQHDDEDYRNLAGEMNHW